jgi:hypothetical protein
MQRHLKFNVTGKNVKIVIVNSNVKIVTLFYGPYRGLGLPVKCRFKYFLASPCLYI